MACYFSIDAAPGQTVIRKKTEIERGTSNQGGKKGEADRTPPLCKPETN